MIRIMLVEDHPSLRHAVADVLNAQSDMTVVAEVADGAAAVAEAIRVVPDVIIADVNLPGIDGIEMTRRILDRLPEVKVIGLTMRDDPYTADAMRDAGARLLLSKADAVHAILAAIRDVDGRQPPPPSAEPQR